MTFPFVRSDGVELSRFTLRSEKGFVYVFQHWIDRWEVRKIAVDDIAVAVLEERSGQELIEGMDPSYRIIEGRCNCPGFGYRHECVHVNEVKARGYVP